jgi:hypothetical protein
VTNPVSFVDSLERNAVEIEPVSDSDNELKQQVSGALRDVRARARSEAKLEGELPVQREHELAHKKLGAIPSDTPTEPPRSPDRNQLNALWDVARALDTPPQGRLGRLLEPLRRPILRVVRFALGPFVEHQNEMNSAQVRFDNDIVSYMDERMDRLAAHYDQMLGLHGKRMEEIDERHLILQQELVQHVHDLVKRIDFVFETAEQNHLYLEGFLRELREELQRLATEMGSSAPRSLSNKDEN